MGNAVDDTGPPPPYEELEQLTSTIPPLDPTPAQGNHAVQPSQEIDLIINRERARTREKRWAVYTARVVDRFTVWLRTCIPKTGPVPTVEGLYHTFPNVRLDWSQKTMPPLGELSANAPVGTVRRRGHRLPETVSSTRAAAAAANLHDRPDVSSDPDKNAHISAHNVVRAQTRAWPDRGRLKALQLRTHYEAARRRAEKWNRRKSGGGAQGDEKNRNNAIMAGAAIGASAAVAYGAWVVAPYEIIPPGPYMHDPNIHPDAYANNPACRNLLPGAEGNCIAGTCGGAVAAGSCGPGGACIAEAIVGGGACSGGGAGGCGRGGGGCGDGGGCGGG
ncbi:hypothetical protein VTN00DRAFT_618 [Thermoascus crustaceus]|uniref:uncharacterized protein n=1 Tax=Thermoascus crustaceus TaxID=5088 RepID=UPI003743E41E